MKTKTQNWSLKELAGWIPKSTGIFGLHLILLTMQDMVVGDLFNILRKIEISENV